MLLLPPWVERLKCLNLGCLIHLLEHEGLSAKVLDPPENIASPQSFQVGSCANEERQADPRGEGRHVPCIPTDHLFFPLFRLYSVGLGLDLWRGGPYPHVAGLRFQEALRGILNLAPTHPMGRAEKRWRIMARASMKKVFA